MIFWLLVVAVVAVVVSVVRWLIHAEKNEEI
jgi:hypothetical protein